MALPPLLLQTAGSLAAILALAGLAWWLRLGGVPALASDEDVRRAAGEVEDGFAPIVSARDTKGRAALAQDSQGRIMLIRRHGNRFAGRLLGTGARAVIWRELGDAALEVDCGEARFGKVVLDLPDPDTWADSINTLGTPVNA